MHIQKRISAPKALGRIKSPKAVPYPLQILNEKVLQVHAIRALGEIGDIRAIQPLRRLLEDGSDKPSQPTINLINETLDLLGVSHAASALEHQLAG